MPVLVVQMGHSGRTSGATGAPGEMAFTEQVGAACRSLLDGRAGWTVRTIAADVASSAYRGDAFVAIHADGNNNPTLAGSSVGYQNASGETLAHAWRDAYIHLGWTGPWHPDNYTDNLHWYYGVTTALRVGNTRACIVECGTITNPTERAAMTGPGGPERVAAAIGHALGIMAAPSPLPEPPPILEDELITYVTCAPKGAGYNLAAILYPNGTMIDISDDWDYARKCAQANINAGKVVEQVVSRATWDRMMTLSVGGTA